MKIEITTHELTQLVSEHASLVSRAEVAESQLRGVQEELAETQKKVPSGGLPVETTLELFATVFGALNSKNKIQAIKALREGLKCGLKEAKDCIETGMSFCQHCASAGKVPLNHSCTKDNKNANDSSPIHGTRPLVDFGSPRSANESPE